MLEEVADHLIIEALDHQVQVDLVVAAQVEH
jgi:hypothetical protein